GNPFTALYRNDATAGFVQLPYKFKPYKYSFTDFGDYNNDGNIDILLAGSSTDGVVQTIAYKNLGGDQFMEIVLYDDRGFNFVKWLDYNNDGLLDVLLVGNEWYSWSYAEKSCKYHILKNCGDDVFKEIVYRKPWVNESQLIALADFDNDSDVDVIQSAIDFNTNNRSVSAFYNKSYVVKPLPAPPVNLNSIRRGKDIILNWDKPTVPANKGISYDLMVGTTPNSNNIVTPLSQLNTGYRMVPQPGFITDTSYKVTISAKGTYYWQVQAVNNSFRGSAFSAVNSFDIGDYFIELTNPFLPLRYDVTFDWGDYDNDGDQDLLLSGMYWVSPDWKWFSYIYENLGNGTFNSTLVKDIGYQGYKLKWIDIDNDNDLDIAGCMGANGLKFIIFENTGAGVFSEVYNTPNYSTDFSYGDFDNNGLTDFFISSNRLLINKGNFTFEERYDFMVPVSFEKVSKSFFDLDNDLDLDMVAIYQGLFVIYENKNHSFVQIPLSLPTFRSSVTDFDLGDLDNDGDLDIIITGNTADGIKSTLLLRNDGKMKFTE
ncbi:MAG: VCBS repeat-containing protein, partial [Bacteroidetes bacterium]